MPSRTSEETIDLSDNLLRHSEFAASEEEESTFELSEEDAYAI